MTKVVVCGYGTVGRKVVEELKKAKVDYTVIDRKTRSSSTSWATQ
jgi:Trk K+ transport system NAD-binding subunit